MPYYDTYINIVLYSKDKKYLEDFTNRVQEKTLGLISWRKIEFDYCIRELGDILFSSERQEYYLKAYIRDVETDEIRKFKNCIRAFYDKKVGCAICYLEWGDTYYCLIDDETNHYFPEKYFIQVQIGNGDTLIRKEMCTTPKEIIKEIEDGIMSLTIIDKFRIIRAFDGDCSVYKKAFHVIDDILTKEFGEDVFLSLHDIARHEI